MAKPKLALIPATQGSKLYSVLPADGVGDFDFSRGSAATRINKDGLIETVASGVSRLNYPLIDGVVNGCPSHLLEPQRLQKIQYSEDFSQWTSFNTSVESNNAISPNGSLNADKISITNASHLIYAQSSVLAQTEYTFSFYFKSGTKDFVEIAFYDDTANSFIETNVNQSSVDYGNGWKKIITNVTTPIGCTSIYSYVDRSSGLGNYYIWGAQLEEGSFPTSYIPNYGTSAGITRSAETANGAGDASTFNDSEGVLMAEISTFEDTMNFEAITLSDGTTNNEVRLYFSSTQNKLSYNLKVNGATQLDGALVGVVFKNNNKILIKYKQNNSSLWVNGFKLLSYNSLDVFSNNVLNEISFSRGNSSNPFYGNTKQIQYFDSALNDSDLETITSWTSFIDLANGQTYSIK